MIEFWFFVFVCWYFVILSFCCFFVFFVLDCKLFFFLVCLEFFVMLLVVVCDVLLFLIRVLFVFCFGSDGFFVNGWVVVGVMWLVEFFIGVFEFFLIFMVLVEIECLYLLKVFCFFRIRMLLWIKVIFMDWCGIKLYCFRIFLLCELVMLCDNV